MNKRKTYLVLGLGIFGSTISKELTKYDQDVIALDQDMTCVERMSDTVAQAVCCDFTDIEQLKAIGIDNVDCAVVATGSHLEESILAIINLKQLGVPYVLAKAKSRRYGEILKKIGADRVVMPEKETGLKVSKELLAWNIVELINLDHDNSLMEIHAPNSWAGKSLLDLNLRRNFNINVLGIRDGGDHHLTITPEPSYVIKQDDQLLVVADKSIFHHYDDLERVVK